MRTVLILILSIPIFLFSQDLEKSVLKVLLKEARVAYQEKEWQQILDLTDTVSMIQEHTDELLELRLEAFYNLEGYAKMDELFKSTDAHLRIYMQLDCIKEYQRFSQLIATDFSCCVDSLKTLLDASVEKDHQFLEWEFLYGRYFQLLGKHQKALEHFKVCMSNSELEINVSAALFSAEQLNDLPMQLKLLDKLEDRIGVQDSIYFKKAKIAYQLGDFSKGIALMEELVESDSELEWTILYADMVLESRSQKHFHNALTLLKSAPKTNEVLELYFHFMKEVGRKMEAYHIASEFILKNGGSEQWYLKRGSLFDTDLLSNVTAELILTDCELGLKLNPQNIELQKLQNEALSFYANISRVTAEQMEKRAIDRSVLYSDYQFVIEYFNYVDTLKATSYAKQAQYIFRKVFREDSSIVNLKNLLNIYVIPVYGIEESKGAKKAFNLWKGLPVNLSDEKDIQYLISIIEKKL